MSVREKWGDLDAGEHAPPLKSNLLSSKFPLPFRKTSQPSFSATAHEGTHDGPGNCNMPHSPGLSPARPA